MRALVLRTLKRHWLTLTMCVVPACLAFLVVIPPARATDLNNACTFTMTNAPSAACQHDDAEKRNGSHNFHQLNGGLAWVYCVACTQPCPSATKIEQDFPDSCSNIHLTVRGDVCQTCVLP
jgi:hypothetical protein